MLELDIEQSQRLVGRKAERRRITPPSSSSGDGTVYELLTPDLDGALEVLRLLIPPGHDTHTTPHWFRNAGPDEVEAIHIIIPPSW